MGEAALLFGGTFAPPHTGHVHAVECASEYVKPDRVIIMPTAIPPHKKKVSKDTPELRLEMCRAAFGNILNCEVSDYEIRKGGISYTVDTIEHLRNQFGELYLMCGSDMLLTLDCWRRAERIFELVKVVCVPRYDADIARLTDSKNDYEARFGADVTIIKSEVLEISSTEVRYMIAAGGDLSEILPRGVIEIIKREKLYI